jgi:hypothetical protein
VLVCALPRTEAVAPVVVKADNLATHEQHLWNGDRYMCHPIPTRHGRLRGGVCAAVIAAVSISGASGLAQAPGASPRAAAARLADGRPDLQGVWNFATITPLQRPSEYAGRETLTAEEVARLENQAARNEFVDRPPPPGDPGAYNRFWIDAGTKVVATHRTSLIVDPPDGRVPPLTAHGRERDAALDAKSNAAAGPEDLTTWDRCLLGFNAGPPIIGGGYNANVQVFQTADYVVLLTEMVHDARIIPLDGRPALSPHIRQWRGDSRGRWDGDTLVIESRNFQPGGTGTLSLRRGGLGFSTDENLRLIERIRRLDADTLQYEYTIDDPTVWTRPWRVSMTMQKSDEPMYEYACHEGNYGMSGILSGARAAERAASAGASKSETK